ASAAVAHNHPKLSSPEFKAKIGEIAICNPANADIYTVEMAQFVSTFNRVCMPDNFQHLFLIAGGSLAVENGLKVAFDWKTKKNLLKNKQIMASKIIHFKEAFHGRSAYSL